MTYTWTQDQLKLLTYGSTIAGRVVVDTACSRQVVLFADLVDDECTISFDPSTLQPPSIEFIRELAKERLGDQSGVSDDPATDEIIVEFGGKRGYTYEFHAYDCPTLDRYRAAVAAILALAGAGLGGGK